MHLSARVLAWLLPAALLVGGALAGWLLDRLLIRRLRAVAARTHWRVDEIALDALGRAHLALPLLLGLDLAYGQLPFSPSQHVDKTFHNALFVAAAAVVTLVASRAAVGLVGLYAERMEGVFPSTTIFANLVKLVVVLLGGMVILQSLGISITPVLTALGVGGLAVALALQDTLSNLFSGFQLLASRQIRPGDYVKLGSGEEGYVRDITWRITTIEPLTLQSVVVPNSKLATAIVTNYALPTTEIALLVPVGVAYASDLDRVEAVTVEVARAVMAEVPGGVPEWEPVIRFTGFGDSAVTFNVVLRVTEYAQQFLVKHEFIKRLHARYRAEGIVIPFPQRVVTLLNPADA